MKFKLPIDAGRPVADDMDRLWGWVSAGAFGLASALFTWAVDKAVSVKPAVIKAAALGTLERTDYGWMIAIILVGVVSAVAILIAFGVNLSRYSTGPRASVGWRWPLVIGCSVVMATLGLSYLAFGGHSAVYTNIDEYGVVVGDRVVHEPWVATSSARIECQMQSSKYGRYAGISLSIGFPDGRTDDEGLRYRPGDTSDKFDWILWVAYKARLAQWADPSQPILQVIPNPDCAQFLQAAPADVQIKFNQLFAPW